MQRFRNFENKNLYMAYLVICPTCGKTMSVNAQVCPHCGEDEFFDISYKKEPRYTKCTACQGSGKAWKYTAYSGRAYNPAFTPQKGDLVVRLNGHKEPFIFEHTLKSPEMLDRLKLDLRQNSFELSGRGPSDYELSWGRTFCPHCGGLGRIEEQWTVQHKVDLRKPVG